MYRQWNFYIASVIDPVSQILKNLIVLGGWLLAAAVQHQGILNDKRNFEAKTRGRDER